MAYLASALIAGSFEDLGVIQPGDGISAGMLASAFIVLQQFIDNMNAEDVMALLWAEGPFTVIAGTQLYTFGAGGTLTTGSAVPVRVVSASSRSGNVRVPCEVMSFAKFHGTVKNDLGSRSIYANVVAVDQNFPLLNLLVHPMPDTAPATLDIGYFSKLTAIATSGTDISTLFPADWFAVLRTGLAMQLYPAYARQANPEVLASNFSNAKAVVAAKNARILGLSANPQQAA